jgi:hypothetical protein
LSIKLCHRPSACGFFFLLLTLPCHGGPQDFGLAELQRAIAARGLNPALFRFRTEVNISLKPESYEIVAGRISGGDLRGLLYGLLDAAEQIRLTGRVAASRGSPAVPMRGIRVFLHNEALEKDWYYSRDYWAEFFAMLARNRFNRFNLVFAHQTNYLAPPYPFWVNIEEFPEIKAQNLTADQQKRNLDMLRFISQTAAEHAIDFTLGIWEHNIQNGMTATVDGITRANIGPYSRAALQKILSECPAIRSIQMRTNSESGIPSDQQVEFYRDYVYPAIAAAGRRVTLDLRGWAMSEGMLDAALNSGAPLRLSAKYWAEDMARPYQPAETFPGYSFHNFLEKPRQYQFYWEVWALGSHRLLLWGDPDFVRRAAPTFTLSGSVGFEIDPPLAQKGFGNRQGEWGIFTSDQKDRVFWKHEFERYWLFYLLWGRLTYDPKTPERVWLSEMQRRFGKAAADVMQAYVYASRVRGEIVAAHLADPNMYIWPEINPGGLIDSYREVRPSDWRTVATIDEAVRNSIDGVASAKQTPLDTSQLLNDLALRAEQALDRARAVIDKNLPEWRSTEIDFQVLATLARYHGRKQMAADHLTWFYETGDDTGLHAARRELTGAGREWDRLVKLTDGVYPAEMAFGPDDVGHWKDKLPYVAHDRKILDERLAIFEQFGRFDFGFDFGGPVPAARGASYRNYPYVLRNTVEPRFRLVEPATKFDPELGYGWVTDASREAVPLTLMPYHETRAVAREPKHLAENTLFGDAIKGQGAQTFRVRTGPGEFNVCFLHPDRSTRETKLAANNGFVDVVFPEGEWTVSGLVLTNVNGGPPPRTRRWLPRPPRPALQHVPLKTTPGGQPLSISLRISPAKDLDIVRLHYRPVNQLAKFKTLEAPATRPNFTIPGEDISARWDLMYYFEILNHSGSGWFEPDPAVATPYFVVTVE